MYCQGIASMSCLNEVSLKIFITAGFHSYRLRFNTRVFSDSINSIMVADT